MGCEYPGKWFPLPTFIVWGFPVTSFCDLDACTSRLVVDDDPVNISSSPSLVCICIGIAWGFIHFSYRLGAGDR